MRRLLAAFLFLFAFAAVAQTAPSPQPVIRYHYGDNLHWADPNFDDSSWPIAVDGRIPSPPFYSDGFLWMRAHVPVPSAANGPYAVQWSASKNGPDVQQLFVNGAGAGQHGQFPPAPEPRRVSKTIVYDIPVALQPGSSAVVCLRGWDMPDDRKESASLVGEFSIGHAALLHALAGQAHAETLLSYTPQFVADLLLDLLGIGVLTLGLWSGRKELLLYALWLVAMPVFMAAISLWAIAVDSPIRPLYTVFLLINAFSMGVVVEFIWTVQGFRDRIFRGAAHACWIVSNIANIFTTVWTQPGLLVAASISLGTWLLFAFNVISAGANLWALVRTRRNRAIAAAMLLINVGFFLRVSGHPVVKIGPFSFEFFIAAFYLSSFVIAALLLHQTYVAWKSSDDLRIEFAAARELQQQLVPLNLPEVAGLRMEAAYLPAQDVGGDFYQVLPQAAGSALVLVGDVSGKGLKAAMTGVLTIGAACALASEDAGPALLLTRLNREMTRFQDGGFITCLCARIAPDGTITLANAGHLSPYRNGEEIELESGLPLGLTTDASYSETMIQLAPGETLTLLSDGVVEAQSATGELFGFERTRSISAKSAQNIAEAAQQFGQQDDITVLTLQFAPVEVLHA